MFKEKSIKFFPITILLILIIGAVLIHFGILKAQPAPGLQGIYIENQLTTAQDANFWIRGHGIFGQTADNLIYLDPTASDLDQNSLYVNNNSALGNFIKFQLNGQKKFEVDKEGAVWLEGVKLLWCKGTCPTWTP